MPMDKLRNGGPSGLQFKNEHGSSILRALYEAVGQLAENRQNRPSKIVSSQKEKTKLAVKDVEKEIVASEIVNWPCGRVQRKLVEYLDLEQDGPRVFPYVKFHLDRCARCLNVAATNEETWSCARVRRKLRSYVRQGEDAPRIQPKVKMHLDTCYRCTQIARLCQSEEDDEDPDLIPAGGTAPGACAWVQPMLSEFAAMGTSGPQAMPEVVKHLRACDPCRKLLSSMPALGEAEPLAEDKDRQFLLNRTSLLLRWVSGRWHWDRPDSATRLPFKIKHLDYVAALRQWQLSIPARGAIAALADGDEETSARLELATPLPDGAARITIAVEPRIGTRQQTLDLRIALELGGEVNGLWVEMIEIEREQRHELDAHLLREDDPFNLSLVPLPGQTYRLGLEWDSGDGTQHHEIELPMHFGEDKPR